MTTAMLDAPAAPASDHPTGHGWAVRILAGPGAGRRVPLTGRLTIGRDPQAGLGIPDQVLSRTHAEIVPADGGWTISDLGSSNGTLVDGVRLAPGAPCALTPGSAIRVGHILIAIETAIPDLPEVNGLRLHGLVGVGSLGHVYAATDREGAAVAVKVPAGPVQAARLRNGAARAMEHPGLVPAWVVDGGILVAPWQDLGSLAEHLSAGPMERERVAVLAAGLVATLAALDEAGIQPVALHPGNILRGLDGRWRLADVLTAAPISLEDPRAPFLPPELVDGRAPDARAVQYGMGAVLLAALTGTTPQPGVAPALDPRRLGMVWPVVIPRLCATDPSSRYPDWAAVAAALEGRESSLGSGPVWQPSAPIHPARPPRSTMPGWVPWAGAAAVGLVAAALAVAGATSTEDRTGTITSAWTPVEVGVKEASALKTPWWLEGTGWKPGDTVTPEPEAPTEVLVARPVIPVDADPPADFAAAPVAPPPEPPAAIAPSPVSAPAPVSAPTTPGPVALPAPPAAVPPLQAALAARAAGRPAKEVLPLFQKAISTKAVFDDQAWIAYGMTLIEARRRADAQKVWAKISPVAQGSTDGLVLAGQLGLVAPALNPQVVAATVVGGAGDQFFREVSFANETTVVAKGGQITLTYNLGTGKGSVSGNPSAPDAEPFSGRTSVHPKAKQELKDPRNGQTYTWTTNQVHPFLMEPVLRSSAGWRLWGWNYQDITETFKSVRWGPLMADSRIYHVWLMPEGKIGALLWTDGGNSALTRDPRDLAKENGAVESGGSMQSSAGGVASMFMLIDPKEGTPLSGTFVYTMPQEQVVDPWGRVYIPASISKSTTPTPIAGAAPEAGGGLFVLRPDLRQPLANLRIGGPKGPGQDRFRAIALSGNMLALAGTTSSPQPQLVKPVQGKPGGGQDAYLVVIKLW